LFDEGVLRTAIFRFYYKRKFPSAKNLALELRDKINYSSSVLSKVLESVGFKCREINDGSTFRNTLTSRNEFLREVHKLRISGDNALKSCSDETRVYRNHSKIHLAELIKKGRLDSSCRKMEQTYCMPRRISKNGLFY